ncbi:MAG TPA: hypothetical protein VMP01_18745 [Pirellulaceae bacterium]|nr:hypothetical protein [Pirellulaceae bacterium]
MVFLNLDRSALGMLVEANLRDRDVITSWPRFASYRLLRDVELSTAIDIPPPEDDGASPPPLPEAMIIFRTRTSASSSLAELVVCEPKLGLRLGSKRVPLSGNTAQDASALADAALAPLKKLDETVSRLWGLAPFHSGNLGSEDVELRQMLAQETEQAILKHRGVFLIELEYVHAIAATRKLAGAVEPIRRRRPWFLVGEYRWEPSESERKLTILLARHVDASTVHRQSLSPLPREAALADLRKRAGEMANTADFPPALDNPAGELQLLDAIRREGQKAGDDLTQIALAEASLLLIDGDQQLRSETALMLGRVAWQVWRKAEELPLPTPPPAAPTVSIRIEGARAAEEIEREYEQSLVRAINLARRGLDHANVVADSLKQPPPPEQMGRNVPKLPVIQYGHAMPIPRPTSSDVLKSLVRPLQQAQARLIMRLAPIHAHNGDGLDGQLIRDLPVADRQAVALRAIAEFKAYPGAETRIRQYVVSALSITTGWSPDDDERFLKQVESIDHPGVAAAVSNARGLVAQRQKGRQPQAVAPAAVRQPQAAHQATQPAEPPSDSDPHIAFKQLVLPWQKMNVGTRCDLCLPCGTDVDLFGASGQLLLMKKKGEAKLLWQGDYGLDFRNFNATPLACYDGKYAWVPASFPLKLPRLLIVDPQSGKVAEVTKEHGLPEGPVPLNFQPMIAAAPLSPGKSLLVGTFGQTWLAIATFDPDKGPSVKVIHECVEQAVSGDDQQWKSSKLAFQPQYLATLSGKMDGAENVEQRVLVGRSARGGAHLHPLLVNPETNQVEVLAAEFTAFAFGRPFAYEGALYASIGSPKGRSIWRTGFSDFHPKLLAEHPLKGNHITWSIGLEANRVHLIHDQWYTAPSWDKPLVPLRGKLPWTRDDHIGLLRSNHYGWIVQTLTSQAYAVEFLDQAESQGANAKGERPAD